MSMSKNKVSEDSQPAINVQILAQLDKLGKGLDNIVQDVAKMKKAKAKKLKERFFFPGCINI